MSEKSSQSSKGQVMSSSSDVPQMMWAAFPPRMTDNRKSWLSSVARTLGWNQRRVKALFYCEARVVTADEWRELNARLDAAKKRERDRYEHCAVLRGFGAAVPVAAREDLPASLPFENGPPIPREKREA